MQTTKHKSETIQGLWHNQHGSEIELVVDSEGRIAGVFRLNQRQVTREFPLSGYVTGNAVSFCVNFPEKQSTTAWVGEVMQGGTLRTIWHMALNAGGSENYAWKAIWSGADNFERGASVKQNDVIQSLTSHPFFCDLI